MATIRTIVDDIITLLAGDAVLQGLGVTVAEGDDRDAQRETPVQVYPSIYVGYSGSPRTSNAAIGRGQGALRRECRIRLYLLTKSTGRPGLHALIERVVGLLTAREFGDDTGRMEFRRDYGIDLPDPEAFCFLLTFYISLDTAIA